MRLSIWIWLFLLIFTVSACIVDAFFCNPPRYVYDVNWVSRPDRPEHCLSDDVSYGLLVYQGALSFVTDLAIFILPIPALYRMTVSRGKWLAISTIFASGKHLFIKSRSFSELTLRGELSRRREHYSHYQASKCQVPKRYRSDRSDM